MRAALTLARWLGPWTRPTSAPRGVVDTALGFGGARGLTGRLYAPIGPMRGAYLMSPGLHPLGPDHPVLDRFCRILAAAGFLVLSPSIPDHRATLFTDRATDDLALALAALRAEAGVRRPAIFAVSFGVLPAMRLAAGDEADGVGGLLLYGGHADFEATSRFVLTGKADGQPDRVPDHRLWPVPFMNLPEIPGLQGDRALLHAAWLAWMAEVWLLDGHDPAIWETAALRHAEALPPELLPIYRLGCGLEPGAAELALTTLAAHPEFSRRFSPTTYAGRVRAPVVILHGADDPVIPPGQAAILAASLTASPRVEAHVTGLYGHTKIAGVREILGMAGALGGEVATAGRVVAGIVRLATDAHAASDP